MMAEEERTSPSPFRKEALEYIATLKPLDELTQISFSLAWLSVLALLLGIVALILWLCFGSIATYITAEGVMLMEDTAVVYVTGSTVHSVQTEMPVVAKIASKEQQYQQITGQVTAVTFLMRGESIAIVKIQFKNSHAHLFAKGSKIKVRIIIHRQTPLSLILSRQII